MMIMGMHMLYVQQLNPSQGRYLCNAEAIELAKRANWSTKRGAIVLPKDQVLLEAVAEGWWETYDLVKYHGEVEKVPTHYGSGGHCITHLIMGENKMILDHNFDGKMAGRVSQASRTLPKDGDSNE
jgi:hypothetical protein